MSERPLPGQIIGYLSDGVTPVRVVAGASEDDDSGTGLDLENPDAPADDADVDDDLVDEDDDDAAAKPVVKTHTQADIDSLKAAQAKRNTEHTTKIRALQAQLREAQKAVKKTDDAGEDASVKALEEATAAAERKFKPVAIRNAAKAALLEAGVSDLSEARMSKLLRMLSIDDIDVEDDGTVAGLDEQIDQIKEDFPEFFAKPEPAPAPAKRPPRGDAADRKNEPPKPRTTGEKIAAELFGGRR